MKNTYHNPQNEQDFDELYVALSKDQNGEGIVSMVTPLGHAPFVFGHKKMMDKMLPMIKNIAKETGKTINIYRFKKEEVLEEIKGSH